LNQRPSTSDGFVTDNNKTKAAGVGGFWVLLRRHEPRPPVHTSGTKIATRGLGVPYGCL
jgi:hypothetical protein